VRVAGQLVQVRLQQLLSNLWFYLVNPGLSRFSLEAFLCTGTVKRSASGAKKVIIKLLSKILQTKIINNTRK